MTSSKLIAYYRVSTAKQGASGLGLEAQREAVHRYLNGGDCHLAAEFTEIESGKKSDRAALKEALGACRLHNARLVIAKLDRLARNVAFISTLMESGVEFVAVDFPQANRLTVHILAAVAEHEAQMTSTRTKAALAAAKARGVRLGGDRGNIANIRAKGIQASLRVRQTKADARAADVVPTMRQIADSGASLNMIARELNARGIPTPSRSGAWTATAVKRSFARTGGSL